MNVVVGGGEGVVDLVGVEFAPSSVEAAGAEEVRFVVDVIFFQVVFVVASLDCEFGLVDGFAIAASSEGADGRLGIEAAHGTSVSGA